jgi:hypothetical protein
MRGEGAVGGLTDGGPSGVNRWQPHAMPEEPAVVPGADAGLPVEAVAN